MPCKVLIVDDSTVFRSQIRAALDGQADIEVVGFASNGKLACDFMQVKQVDLVTLDLEMPVMNGIETLKEMKRLGVKTRAIVFSSQTQRGAEATLNALQAGAVDFLPKPQLDAAGGKSPADVIRASLVPKILQFMRPAVAISAVKAPATLNAPAGRFNWRAFSPEAVVIASSTGGPTALEELFGACPGSAPRCPVFIAQHMPPMFTTMLAERLSRIGNVKVVEAQDGMKAEAGCVYVAPGDYHMTVEKRGSDVFVKLDQSALRNSVRPAADFLFESAAKVFKNGLLGVVLTGMGSDGKDGAIAIKNQNGGVIIQDRESSVVFGMPGAVHDAGAFDAMARPSAIAQQMLDLRVFSGVLRMKEKAG